ncbi:MAG TPA: hypothetical protein DF984_00020 [Anaerolineaceae bacterium]|nr:hypothetical protein [Anaerolineaceae bacterium]
MLVWGDPMSKRLIANLQTVGILFTMSLGTVLSKILLADISPFTFVWTSMGAGMIVMCVYTFAIKMEPIPKKLGKNVWLIIIAIGICNFTISRLTRPIAIERLPVTTTAYVRNFIGFLTIVMSNILLKEYPSIFQVIGVGIAVWGLTIYFKDPLIILNERLTIHQVIGMSLMIVGLVLVQLWKEKLDLLFQKKSFPKTPALNQPTQEIDEMRS